MKTIKNVFFLILTTTVTSLYPCTPQKQVEKNIDNEYRNIRSIANECDCIDLAIGKKNLETILMTCQIGVEENATKDVDDKFLIQEIWRNFLFEKKDEENRTLKEKVSLSDAPLCVYTRERLQMMEHAFLEGYTRPLEQEIEKIMANRYTSKTLFESDEK